jgi:hypothetical protein
MVDVVYSLSFLNQSLDAGLKVSILIDPPGVEYHFIPDIKGMVRCSLFKSNGPDILRLSGVSIDTSSLHYELASKKVVMKVYPLNFDACFDSEVTDSDILDLKKKVKAFTTQPAPTHRPVKSQPTTQSLLDRIKDIAKYMENND